ncbi:MAG TPA: hypothetical protein VFP84_39455 [Kofleriaceae bacterium]|nr:hypothetical protein [Kofleriaceae bacterium]
MVDAGELGRGAPGFRRELEERFASAVPLAVTEGNYLLHLLDEVWFSVTS